LGTESGLQVSQENMIKKLINVTPTIFFFGTKQRSFKEENSQI
jgi:hypothetical protein